MAIASDKDGFLIGEPTVIDSGKFSRAAAIWSEMREDIGAIREAIENGSRISGRSAAAAKASERRAVTSPPKIQVVATPSRASAMNRVLPQRDTRGRFISSAAVAAEPTRRVRAPVVAATEPMGDSNGAALPGRRDSRGRFVGSRSPGTNDNPDSPRNPNSPQSQPGDDGGGSGFWRRITGDVASATRAGIAQTAESAESIDPSIAAAKEAGNIVAPVLKPIGALLGGVFGRNSERKKRKEAAKENAKEQHKQDLPWYKKLLKERPVATAAGGGLGMMGALLPMLGGLLAGAVPLLIAGAGVLAAGALGAWIGKTVGGWINDNFGTQISDFIWDTSEFIKEKWAGVTSAWDAVTAKASQWIDNVSNAWSATKRLPGRVGGAISDKFDQAKSALGFGSAGRRKTFEDAMTSAGISNPSERAMLLAQAHHETGGFRSMEEGFKYSPDVLRRTSKRAANLSQTQMAGLMRSGERGIAEFMYGGRNGNNEKGDGYKYRGRGYVQLTGKANYAEASKALGIDLVANPDLAADPQIAARIATWWHKSRGLGAAARAGDVGAVTRGINGGTNGLSDRARLFQQYGGTPASASGSGAALRGAISPSSALISRSSSFGAATPSVEKYTPGKAPPLLTALGSRGNGQQTIQAIVTTPINQNVGDRSIAQVATGGMGGTGQ